MFGVYCADMAQYAYHIPFKKCDGGPRKQHVQGSHLVAEGCILLYVTITRRIGNGDELMYRWEDSTRHQYCCMSAHSRHANTVMRGS